MSDNNRRVPIFGSPRIMLAVALVIWPIEGLRIAGVI